MAMRITSKGLARPLRAARRACPARKHLSYSVQDAWAQTRERLREAGVLDGSDANALVAHALVEPRLVNSKDIFLHMDRKLASIEAVRLHALVQRRCSGEPLAYVLEHKEFWSLDFHVTRDTLIPRSDSEILIETVVSLYPPSASLRILDIGTGSGCLLLSALAAFPHATGVAIDICPRTLHVAQGNAHRLSLDDRASFLEFDMEKLPHEPSPTAELMTASQIPRALLQGFDVILCNPPYIPRQNKNLIASDVLAYEPHGALFAEGADALTQSSVRETESEADPLGLRYYKALAHSVNALVAHESAHASAVVIETGSQEQAHAVKKLFEPTNISCRCELFDTAGRHRGLLFQRER